MCECDSAALSRYSALTALSASLQESNGPSKVITRVELRVPLYFKKFKSDSRIQIPSFQKKIVGDTSSQTL